MKKYFKYLFVFLCFTLFFILCSCSNNTHNNKNIKNNVNNLKENVTNYPQKFIDNIKNEIILKSEPKKIVSLVPSTTETIFALGKENLLVGRTDYCTYPEQTKNIPSVGKIDIPNIEKIIELQPDIVFVTSLTNPDIIKKLETAKIKIFYVLDNNNLSFNAIYDNITILGDILHAQNEAKKINDTIKNKVEEVTSKVNSARKPKVYYVISYGQGGDYTSTGDTFLGELLQLAGGNNIANTAKGWKFTKEQLILSNPDIIILPKYSEMKKGFTSTAGYSSLKAVKDGNVYEIDNNILEIPGPRLSKGIEELAKIIHPEIFKQ